MSIVDDEKHKTFKGFIFFISVYEAGYSLSEKHRQKFYTCALDYLYRDITPTFGKRENDIRVAFMSSKYTFDSQKSGQKRNTPAVPPAVPSAVPPAVQEEEKNNKERTINSSKETAKPFSLTNQNHVDSIPYTKWTREQFTDEVYKHCDDSGIAEDFIAYWTEPTPKGKMRFQKEGAWDTGRRLTTWKARNNRTTTPEPKLSYDEQIALMQAR